MYTQEQTASVLDSLIGKGLNDATSIKKALKSAITRNLNAYKKHQADTHVLLVSLVNHIKLHGDVRLLAEFLEGLGSRSQRARDICTWIREHGKVGEDQILMARYSKKDKKFIVKVDGKEKDLIAVNVYAANPWFDAEPVEKKTTWELEAAIIRLVARAHKPVADGGAGLEFDELETKIHSVIEKQRNAA